MLLAVDIGNTNIVLGIFEGERLLRSWRLATDVQKTADEYAALVQTLLSQGGKRVRQLQGVCISSVVPQLTLTFRELAEQGFGLPSIVVSADVESGIRIVTDNPREVGADRIANAVAAARLHRLPAVVVDFGTATTFDAISASGELLGTSIAPGFQSSMEGLYRHAAQLHSVELIAPRAAIGRNTVDSLRSGAIFGYVGLVEGLVQRIRLELGGDPLVIATGGLAPVVVDVTTVFAVHDPELTLHGLRLIYELNSESGRAGERASGRTAEPGATAADGSSPARENSPTPSSQRA